MKLYRKLQEISYTHIIIMLNKVKLLAHIIIDKRKRYIETCDVLEKPSEKLTISSIQSESVQIRVKVVTNMDAGA